MALLVIYRNWRISRFVVILIFDTRTMERLGVGVEFIAMKPACDRFANEPTAQNIKRLGDHIQRQTSAVIQYHLEFILLPIYVHLHNENLSKDVKQHLIQLLRSVLCKSRITTLNCFLKIYTALLVQIYDPHRANMLIEAHEELKESTIECLRDLVKSSSTDVIESLYVGVNAPKLSQGVYACLSIARTEKLCSLRVSAIETLMTLSNVHDAADDNDVALRNQVADIFMLFLPGIASSLCQIALENELQNHRITMMAIRAYGRIISLVMANNVEEEELTIDSLESVENVKKSQDPLGMRLKLEGNEGMKRYIEMARRTRDWLDAASTKLNASMQSLMKLLGHSHFQVRKELALAVKLIITKCSRHMIKNYAVLVETLISLSEDQVEEIKDFARASLNDDVIVELRKNCSMRPVVEILEENFYKLLTKLPRLIRRSDDRIQLCYLNQLAGYIRLLGKERLPRVMASSSHLKRLVLALVYVAELDCTHVSLMENFEMKDIEDPTTRINFHAFKYLKFIKESGTEEELRSVCKLLGELGDPVLLVDCIFELVSEMPRYRNELTLLLNWISAVPVENSSMPAVLKRVNNYYTDPENWYLPIKVEKDVTLREAQNNVVYCCLVTSGLGIIALNLGAEYQEHLLKTLYLVIERAGSENGLLRESGLNSLEAIAHSQNYRNVGELLRDNVDYVSYHMTTKMHRVERNPRVLDVFSVVMKYSTIEMLACPKEVVQVALDQLSADSQQQRNSYGLLKILYVFVVCMRKMTASRETIERIPEKTAEPNPAEIVIRAVLDRYNAKRNSERLDDEIVTTTGDLEAELEDGTAAQFTAYHDQDEKAIPPPSHINMTESVMKCCLNFLPSKEVPKSLLTMQIMEEGLAILSKWNEQLLPIVHELWHPLVRRFHDSNILVIKQAWQLLCTLAHVSEDFIRSRTLKEVLPSLSQFLTKSAKESYNKDSKSAYKFTHIFKLQKLILSQSATLAKNLKLQERQLWEMLEIAQPYLSDNQHPVLQECCVNLFIDVAKFQADIVWVKCLNVWNNHVAKIPTDSKLTLECLKETIPTIGDNRQSDYRKSLERIFIFIEEMSAVYS